MTRQSWKTLAWALLAALAACGGGTPPAARPATPSGPEPATLSNISSAEGDARSVTRVGIRPLVGAKADGILAEIDAARAAVLPALPAGASVSTRLVVAASTGPATASVLAGLLIGLSPGAARGTASNSIQVDGALGSATASFTRTISQSGSTLYADMSATTVYSITGGGQMTELTTASAEVGICPDASGQVPLRYTFHDDIRLATGGVQVDLSGSVTATVGDDAQLQRWTTDTQLTYAAQGGALPVTGTGAQVHVTRTLDWSSSDISGATMEVVRDTTVDGIVQGLKDVQNRMAPLLERYALEKAQEQWQGGACVEIVVTGASDANTVAASSVTPFTATAHHKVEGVDLVVPISAALSGGKALDPTAPTPSPVSYGYTAPDQADQTATASLESRSRRGVARHAVTFTTAKAAWLATFSFTGTAADSTGTLHWSGRASVTLTQSSAAGGGATFLPDPGSPITVDAADSDSSSEACVLQGTASGTVLGGNMVTLSSPPQYAFTLVGTATGSAQCTSKTDGKVTTKPMGLAVTMTTSPGGGDPGFRAIADPKLLSGTGTFAAGAETVNTTWSIVPR